MAAKMAAGVTRHGAGESCQEFSRIKPEIYQTKDSKVIVEDELLNFIVVKLRTLSHNYILSLATSSFSSERIEASKTVLSELYPNSIRWVAHRGQKKDINNVKMCLQVLNHDLCHISWMNYLLFHKTTWTCQCFSTKCCK